MRIIGGCFCERGMISIHPLTSWQSWVCLRPSWVDLSHLWRACTSCRPPPCCTSGRHWRDPPPHRLGSYPCRLQVSASACCCQCRPHISTTVKRMKIYAVKPFNSCPDPTCDWHPPFMTTTDGNQYSWAFALSLATLPDLPPYLMEIRAYTDQHSAQRVPAMIAQADLGNVSRPVDAHALIMHFNHEWWIWWRCFHILKIFW